jgi:hypothetical protein
MFSLLVTAAVIGGVAAQTTGERMTFFLTSVGKGDGANLGGLAGADAHCGQLAANAGANSTGLIWRAYLSANQTRTNARDRIGAGPWHNARGVRVATDVANLHANNGSMNQLGKANTLTERGAQVNGRNDQPNQHDILTGSTANGDLIANATCNDWTSNATSGVIARVGHHDKEGGGEAPTSWNSAHTTRGCSQSALVSTGGAALFYCFAQPGNSGTTFTARPTFSFSTRFTTTTTTARPTTTRPTTTRTRFGFTTRTNGSSGSSTSSDNGSTSSSGSTSSTSSTSTTTTTSAGGSNAASTAPVGGGESTTPGATFGGASDASTLPNAAGDSSAAPASEGVVDSSDVSTTMLASTAAIVAALIASI